MPAPHTTLKLAVLIDGENASARMAEALFTEIATLGEATGRRIYGDAASAALKHWVEILPHWAIQWQQSFQNTKGKNSGDIALVIDAMDLMHSNRFDGFCIVSSDSDFTRLAARIREHGLPVYGFGERKTPESFIQACTRFIYVENMMSGAVSDTAKTENTAIPKTTRVAPKAPKKSKKNDLNHARQIIINALKITDDDGDGWADLGMLGNRLRSTYPDFDHRTYGSTKLSDLVRTLPGLEVGKKPGNVMIVRIKPAG